MGQSKVNMFPAFRFWKIYSTVDGHDTRPYFDMLATKFGDHSLDVGPMREHRQRYEVNNALLNVLTCSQPHETYHLQKSRSIQAPLRYEGFGSVSPIVPSEQAHLS